MADTAREADGEAGLEGVDCMMHLLCGIARGEHAKPRGGLFAME